MNPELHQCPCCPSTQCAMDEPCLGCETYAEWSIENIASKRLNKISVETISFEEMKKKFDAD